MNNTFHRQRNKRREFFFKHDFYKTGVTFVFLITHLSNFDKYFENNKINEIIKSY
jgi:hypothetical protein